MIEERQVMEALRANHTLEEAGEYLNHVRRLTRERDQAASEQRDIFAAAALQGLTAGNPGLHTSPTEAADRAYSLADAMMKRREKK